MSGEERPADALEGTIALPIDGVLDLHAFAPKDALSVTEEYLKECLAAGVFEVRIIHGKGSGVQARAVKTLLSRLPFVRHHSDADIGGGGWGATVVTLERRSSLK